MCRMLGFIMFWIAVGMIIGLIFTGSMFWHIVIFSKKVLQNVICSDTIISVVGKFTQYR